MNIQARFFVRRENLDAATIMASEMWVAYTGALEENLEQNGGYEIALQIHGYDFRHMYSEDRVISLEGIVIQAYHFDTQGKFAGFTLQDVATGVRESVIATDVDWLELSTYEVSDEIVNSYQHTRLVGFRTSLTCRTS